jgi:hypothetical protein
VVYLEERQTDIAVDIGTALVLPTVGCMQGVCCEMCCVGGVLCSVLCGVCCVLYSVWGVLRGVCAEGVRCVVCGVRCAEGLQFDVACAGT